MTTRTYAHIEVVWEVTGVRARLLFLKTKNSALILVQNTLIMSISALNVLFKMLF